MSYSMSLSGHGADADDLKEVFENTVRALRAITPDGGTGPGGQISGSGGDGTSFSLSTFDVADVEAADTDDEAADPAAPEEA